MGVAAVVAVPAWTTCADSGSGRTRLLGRLR